MSEQWGCLFDGRAGARARAGFLSKDEAKEFAERHAQLTATGMPLKCYDLGDSLVLTTPDGSYLIALTDDNHPPPSRAVPATESHAPRELRLLAALLDPLVGHNHH